MSARIHFIRCTYYYTPVRVYIIIINNNTLLDRVESNFLDKHKLLVAFDYIHRCETAAPPSA